MDTEKTLLRIVTTGSVDDGKSTLMGRLLYETGCVPADQYEAARRTSSKRGEAEVDLSLLFDGLAAEREQRITIDVAYRYFETPRRRFIVADCPGHEQYTRNMVTGASTADCAVVLVDARNGLVRQSRRHAFILSLLQVPHVIVVVNKMDAVGYAAGVYGRIVDEYRAYAQRLQFRDLAFLPASATAGDNVTSRSARMPWFDGPDLLHALESLQVFADRNLIDFRLPVQTVIRPNQDYRGFAGRIASGTIRSGEEVAVLPSGRTSRIKSIETFDGPLAEAFAPQSVVVTLTDEVDVGRGSMLVRPRSLPEIGHHIDATICWMDDEPLRVGAPYLLKHTTRTVKAFVSKVISSFDVDTLHRRDSEALGLNDLGRVEIQVALPIFFDPYKLNRATGSFILIDPATNRTVAGGTIRGACAALHDARSGPANQHRSPNTIPRPANIPLDAREARNGHRAAVVWLTGLSGSGKSTLGTLLERKLFDRGCRTMLLDGDQLRQGLCGDLGFTPEDRTENIRRAGEVARLFFESGHIVIGTFISPIARDRAFVRSLIPEGRFWEVHVDCAIEVCLARDPNGLYARAMKGDIRQFTGVSSNYEPPSSPELVVHTDRADPTAIVDELLERLKDAGILA